MTISVLCVIGALRLPQPLIAAGIIATTYSLFGHKEYRFIYPAILLTVIVSDIGLAQIVCWVGEVLRDRGWGRRRATVVPSATAAIVVILTQLASANGSEPYHRLWTRGRGMVLASRYAAKLDAVCGIGVLDHDWFVTGGYAPFHHAVPLYWATSMGPLDPDPVFSTPSFTIMGNPWAPAMSRKRALPTAASHSAEHGHACADDGHVTSSAPAWSLAG